ncbi:hypothetical protein ACCP96_13335 [Xanthomonas campestris pv. fici]|uniref:hypothetical protein n=1 Tax=Xanthomonas euvesicatoria TaxID=456327 RepID=UPI003556EFDD
MSTLKEQLEQHLFKIISTQIERIAYMPEDLEKIARNVVPSAASSRSRRRTRLANRKINDYYDYQFYIGDRIYDLVWGDSA